MRILYGVQGHYKDVTEIAKKQFKYECLCMNNARYLRIPANAGKRDRVFGDPIYGTLKHILLNGEIKKGGILYINMDMHEKISPASNIRKKLNLDPNHVLDIPYDNAKQRLELIHSSLALNHTIFTDFFELQVNCVMYVKPISNVAFIVNDNKCYQIPLIISSLLINDNTFTVFCNNLDIKEKIIENRDLNEFSFKVETFNENLLDSKAFDIIIVIDLSKDYELNKKGYNLKTAQNFHIWTINPV